MYVVRLRAYEAQVAQRIQRPRKRYAGQDVLEWMIEAKTRRPGYAGAILLFQVATDMNVHAQEAEALSLLAVARLDALKKGPGAKFRALHAYDWADAPRVPVVALLQKLSGQVGTELLAKLSDDAPIPLGEVAAGLVNTALISLAPELGQLLEQKQERPAHNAAGDDEKVEGERCDRFVTGLRLSGLPWQNIEPVEVSTGNLPQEIRRFDKKLREHDMASHDASIFPDWERLRNVAGWYEFRHANRRVLIKNIDFSPDETNTGGDLVYIRQQPDAAIFVQYKRLTEPTRAVKGWTFRDDGRLRQQLDTLIMESGKLMPASLPLSGHTDYRLNDQTGFLKFVDARPVASDGLSPLAGCYLPAEYAVAVLHELEDDRGRLPPMDPRKVRYLDSQTFVRLVADGWIGSCSPGTKAIAERMLPMLRDERTGEVTYVFDDPAARSA